MHYNMFTNKIFFSQDELSIEDSLVELLPQLKLCANLVKLTIFIDLKSENDYVSTKDSVINLVFKELGENSPNPTIVAQKPLINSLVIEYMQYHGQGEVNYKKHQDNNYVVVNENEQKMLFINGVESNKKSIVAQSEDVFEQVEGILSINKMPINSIIRQWNYIPDILCFKDDIQNYQAFNDVRTNFYNKTEWNKGYPAATGIGVVSGKLTIDFVTINEGQVYPIINPNQIDAHGYSEVVLEKGLDIKSTPKFERAKLVSSVNGSVVFVSGTAAIIGEESREGSSVFKQTLMTLDHIDTLLSEKCIQQEGDYKKPQIQSIRAYVKNIEDLKIVQNICSKRYPEIPVVYVEADVCRNELLIEIEAFASF